MKMIKELNCTRLTLLLTLICLTLSLSSCGSTWNVEGNNITIHKAENDTVIPKGTLYITNDSLR